MPENKVKYHLNRIKIFKFQLLYIVSAPILLAFLLFFINGIYEEYYFSSFFISNFILTGIFLFVFALDLLKKKGANNESLDFYNIYLRLSADLMRIDAQFGAKERHFLETYFQSELGSSSTQIKMKQFEYYLQHQSDDRFNATLNDYLLTNKEKIRIIYLLFSLAQSGRSVSISETNFLHLLSVRLDMPEATFNSLKLMFVTQSAINDFLNDFEQQQKNDEHQNQQTETPYQSDYYNYLQNCYTLLGISEDVSNEEVKKAYRTLAKIHHPDMYQNESETLKIQAKETFQIINTAYEFVKSQRNMN